MPLPRKEFRPTQTKKKRKIKHIKEVVYPRRKNYIVQVGICLGYMKHGRFMQKKW